MVKNISTFACVFGVFGVFLQIFLMYSCSKSFRELKNAIKNQFFLFLGGLVAKLIEKKHVEEYWYRQGKILGRLAFYTWVLSNEGDTGKL